MKEVNPMEEKKEGGFPFLVWAIVLGLSAAVIAAVVLFLK
jgi:hypothetical protein